MFYIARGCVCVICSRSRDGGCVSVLLSSRLLLSYGPVVIENLCASFLLNNSFAHPSKLRIWLWFSLLCLQLVGDKRHIHPQNFNPSGTRFEQEWHWIDFGCVPVQKNFMLSIFWVTRFGASIIIRTPCFFRSSRMDVVYESLFKFSNVSLISFICSSSIQMTSWDTPSNRRSISNLRLSLTNEAMSRICSQILDETHSERCCCGCGRMSTTPTRYPWCSSTCWESLEWCSIPVLRNYVVDAICPRKIVSDCSVRFRLHNPWSCARENFSQ